MSMLYYFVFASLTLGMSQDANSDYYSHTSYHSSSSLDITDESLAIDILDEYNGEVTKYYGNVLGKKFAYYTNYTKENLNLLVDAFEKLITYTAPVTFKLASFRVANFSYETKRRIEALLKPNIGGQSDSMITRYSQATVCISEDNCFKLNPDLTRIMAQSRDYDELYWAWNSWRKVAGQPSRADFIADVTAGTKFAQLAGFSDPGALWRSLYEVDDLEEQIRNLYLEIAPLYTQLHAYVRRQLYNYYGPDYINLRGPIPAHLLGNMWAGHWANILDILQPYPGNHSLELAAAICKKFHTGEELFRTSEDFFVSLGMLKAPQSFWEESMFERPQDGRQVVCHGTAWDFRNRRDFRISICSDFTLVDFLIANHEMGHIQYYMQYADQPIAFRNGANPGFHEAMGDVITLSVSTPEYHREIDLIKRVEQKKEADINFLMGQALDKLAMIPYAFIVDLWRWRAFDGSIPSAEYNAKWWEFRQLYQGVIPPTPRSENDFDPASKYHISAGVPYIRYFISSVLQFQFHQALCNVSGHVGPLFKCNIHNSKEAGKLLTKTMKMGSSQHWTEVLKIITGQKEMKADAILEYFKPLFDWLKKQNENEVLGWDHVNEWYPKDPKPWYGRASFEVQRCSTTVLIVSLFLHWLLS